MKNLTPVIFGVGLGLSLFIGINSGLMGRPLIPGAEAEEDYVPPEASGEDGPAVEETGESLYASNCGVCHQPTGVGVPGAFPPLAGSEWVTADPETPIRVIIAGLSGSIDVAGTTYNSAMPGLSNLSDEQVALVTTYIRTSWDNGADEVTAETVAAVRAELDGRGPIDGGEELAGLRAQ